MCFFSSQEVSNWTVSTSLACGAFGGALRSSDGADTRPLCCQWLRHRFIILYLQPYAGLLASIRAGMDPALSSDVQSTRRCSEGGSSHCCYTHSHLLCSQVHATPPDQRASLKSPLHTKLTYLPFYNRGLHNEKQVFVPSCYTRKTIFLSVLFLTIFYIWLVC